MPRYEYKVVPAPRRGEKARGAKTTEERFALALATLMNGLGADGWKYLRADTLSVEERRTFGGTTSSSVTVLVFRRDVADPLPDLERTVVRPAFARPPSEREMPAAEMPRLNARAPEAAAPARPLQAGGDAPGHAPRLGPARGEGDGG